MAKVEKRGNSFVVVNSRNGVPVGGKNRFSTRAKAQTKADSVKCRVIGKCPHKKRR